MSAQRIGATLQVAVTGGQLVGVAACTWHGSELLCVGAAGEAALASEMQADTMVWIASMTKYVTATAGLHFESFERSVFAAVPR